MSSLKSFKAFQEVLPIAEVTGKDYDNTRCTNNVYLPSSLTSALFDAHDTNSGAFLFEITLTGTSKRAYVSLQGFTPGDSLLVPPWVMKHLSAVNGDFVVLTRIRTLKSCTSMCLKPLNSSFFDDIQDYEFALQNALSCNYSAIEQNTVIDIEFGTTVYSVEVVSCEPQSAVSLLDTTSTCSVDLTEKRETHTKVTTDNPLNSSVKMNEYTDFALRTSGSSRLKAEINIQSGDAVLFASRLDKQPRRNRFQASTILTETNYIILSEEKTRLPIQSHFFDLPAHHSETSKIGTSEQDEVHWVYFSVMGYKEDCEFSLIITKTDEEDPYELERKETRLEAKKKAEAEEEEEEEDEEGEEEEREGEDVEYVYEYVDEDGNVLEEETCEIKKGNKDAVCLPPPQTASSSSSTHSLAPLSSSSQPAKKVLAKCRNCGLELPELQMIMHERHCAEFVRVCPHCEKKMRPSMLDRHIDLRHTKVKCDCGLELYPINIPDHVTLSCGKRPAVCNICQQVYTVDTLPSHQLRCYDTLYGCRICGERIQGQYMKSHIQNVHVLGLTRVQPSSSTSSSSSKDSRTQRSALYQPYTVPTPSKLEEARSSLKPTVDTSLVCPYCSLSGFADFEELQVHMLTSHADTFT